MMGGRRGSTDAALDVRGEITTGRIKMTEGSHLETLIVAALGQAVAEDRLDIAEHCYRPSKLSTY
jgi:hypothetical protein